MACVVEPTDEMEAEYRRWVESRPPVVRAIAERLRPWKLYRLKSTGQRVTMASIFEDGTVSVEITGDYNLIAFDRRVFGIDPGDMEECDLPGADEALGARMSPEQLDANQDALRVMIRPDLWTMGEDGKAHRRN